MAELTGNSYKLSQCEIHSQTENRFAQLGWLTGNLLRASFETRGRAAATSDGAGATAVVRVQEPQDLGRQPPVSVGSVQSTPTAVWWVVVYQILVD